MKPYTKLVVRRAAKCLVEGCMRSEELANGRSAGGLCAGHRKRKVLGQPLDTPISDALGHRLTPLRLLEVAALSFAAAPAEETGRARRRLRRAAEGYARRSTKR